METQTPSPIQASCRTWGGGERVLAGGGGGEDHLIQATDTECIVKNLFGFGSL